MRELAGHMLAAIMGGYFGLSAYEAFGWAGVLFGIPGYLAIGAGAKTSIDLVFRRDYAPYRD